MFSSKKCKQNSRKHELFEVGGLRLPAFFLAGALTLFISPEHSESAQRNGFSIEDPLLPLEEILGGGPPRDGIPSIDSPKFVLAPEVNWLFPDCGNIGLYIEGDILVYPLAILNWHEIVNDTVGGCSCFNHILPPLWKLVSAFCLKINHE